MLRTRPRSSIESLLVAVYFVFSLAAMARSSYQLVTKYEEAPFAYWLSLVSGLIYATGAFALITRRLSLIKVTMVIELVGVVLVGLLSYLTPSLFGHPSVWSQFGSGYGYIPLVLPIVGIFWAYRKNEAGQ